MVLHKIKMGIKRFIFVLGILVLLVGGSSISCFADAPRVGDVVKDHYYFILWDRVIITVVIFLVIVIIVIWIRSHLQKTKEKEKIEVDLEKIKESDKKSKYCTQCGNKLSPEDKFCGSCSAKV